MAGRYLMLKDRMQTLRLPLIAMAIWAAVGALVGLVSGSMLWVIGLGLGALIGGYAAFGNGPAAATLRWPAIGVAAVLTLFGGSR